jgi:hypothetical protein
VSVPECPANRVGGGEILNDNAGFRQNGGKFIVLCEEPSEMRKQALRDVEQIDRRRSEQAIGRETG